MEFYQETGTRISEHNEQERQKKSPYNFAYFVLNDERKKLYERIDQRIDQMLDDGLAEEVTFLKKKGYTRDMVSMQGLGYKEILDYLDGTISLEEAIYRIKRDTQHPGIYDNYITAKRNITGTDGIESNSRRGENYEYRNNHRHVSGTGRRQRRSGFWKCR